MTKIIGLTGGIGSGKTTIGDFFRKSGIPLYVADEEARRITEQPEVAAAVKSAFGESFFKDGKLDRPALARMVFDNPEKLQQLNNIIHPAVKAHFMEWLKNHSGSQFVMRETAILFESGIYADCDFIITVTAPLETRINRVMQRDNVSRQSIESRMKNQWTDEQRISKSDFVIENSDLQEAEKQAAKILKKLSIQQN